MPGDVLSQAEVESLLSVVVADTVPAPPATARSRLRDKVTRYDPKHHDGVLDGPMRALQTLHERFARDFGAALSSLVRSNVEVTLRGTERLTYGQFVFGLESPTCLNLLKGEPLENKAVASEGRKPPGALNLLQVEPLENKAVLEINPSILYPIIDRLLGGGHETCRMARRPLTEIERRLVRRITAVFLAELRRAWKNVLPLDLEVIRVESDPRLVELVSPSEIVVVIGFELTMDGTRGMMNLCIPLSSIDHIRDKLSSNARPGDDGQQATPHSTESISGKEQGSPLELVVRMAHTRISKQELIGLEVGDIITTEKSIHAPLIVEIEGIAGFHVWPGAFEGRKAVRIEETPRPGLHDH